MLVKDIKVADSIFEVDLSISLSLDAELTREYSNKYMLYCSKIDMWERFDVEQYHREIQSDL